MSLPSIRFRPVWRAAGYLFFALGAAGALLPLLPTTGPWILAVWCLWKGDDPLARKLLDHPQVGTHLRRWFERGAICRGGKIAATAGMTVCVLAAGFAGLAALPLMVLAGLLASASLWLWSRPEEGAPVALSVERA
jgi:uncharacterized membrane protein YbaN (DUF454 family)